MPLYGPQNFDALTVGQLAPGWTNIGAASFLVGTDAPISSPQAFGEHAPVHNDMALWTGIAAAADLSIQFSHRINLGAGNANAAPSCVLRSDTAGTNLYLVACDFGAGLLYWYKRVGGSYSQVGATAAIPDSVWGGTALVDGDLIVQKAQIEGATLAWKGWRVGSAEPADWVLSTTDSSVTAAGYAGVRLQVPYAVPITVDDLIIDVPSSPDTTIAADDPGFRYFGRWHLTGAGPTARAITINAGARCEFAYSGNLCTLNFDVSGFSVYPDILTRVDRGAWVRASLTGATGTVTLAPASNTLPSGSPPFNPVASEYHTVEFTACIPSSSGSQWTSLDGACQFTGITAGTGDGLIAIPSPPNRIEFLGDSITAGNRLLYTGTDLDQGDQHPPLGWPWIAADYLALKPIVTGFGGQGLSTTGSQGVPVATTAFPLIDAGASWSPAAPPVAVVLYVGTNDSGMSSGAFQAAMQTYLGTIRAAYPAAYLVAINPHSASRAAEIAAAVAARADPRMAAADAAGAGILAPGDTSDGTHLNPGGAARLGAWVASLVQAQLDASGVKVQATAGGAAPPLIHSNTYTFIG